MRPLFAAQQVLLSVETLLPRLVFCSCTCLELVTGNAACPYILLVSCLLVMLLHFFINPHCFCWPKLCNKPFTLLQKLMQESSNI